jgi:hypothetical protein
MQSSIYLFFVIEWKVASTNGAPVQWDETPGKLVLAGKQRKEKKKAWGRISVSKALMAKDNIVLISMRHVYQ